MQVKNIGYTSMYMTLRLKSRDIIIYTINGIETKKLMEEKNLIYNKTCIVTEIFKGIIYKLYDRNFDERLGR